MGSISLFHRRSLSTGAGFTLIELIISIVLIGLLGTVSVRMIQDTQTTTDVLNANQTSAAQVRNALERLEREIRETKSVTSMSTTKLVFVRTDDVTITVCNGAPACTGGSNLTLNGSNLLDKQITDFRLIYHRIDPDTGQLSATGVTISNVRFVEINLTVSDTDVDSGQRPITQRSRVALRN